MSKIASGAINNTLIGKVNSVNGALERGFPELDLLENELDTCIFRYDSEITSRGLERYEPHYNKAVALQEHLLELIRADSTPIAL